MINLAQFPKNEVTSAAEHSPSLTTPTHSSKSRTAAAPRQPRCPRPQSEDDYSDSSGGLGGYEYPTWYAPGEENGYYPGTPSGGCAAPVRGPANRPVPVADLYYNYQDGLNSQDSQRPFSSSSSSSSFTDYEYQQHYVPLHIVSSTTQHHVPEHSLVDQVPDPHVYDSFGAVPCGFNNNHHNHYHHQVRQSASISTPHTNHL